MCPEAISSELFAALRAPACDAPAIEADPTRGCRELAARVDRLAVRRKTYGARLESIVAAALAGLARLVTAALAIAQGGAAGLPLNPKSPGGHGSYILTDALDSCTTTPNGNRCPLMKSAHRDLILPAPAAGICQTLDRALR
jgi:hypothetical protein